MNNSPVSRNEARGGFTQMHRAVAEFHAAWQSAAQGQAAPRLEAILEAVPQAERSAWLRELLAVELEYRVMRRESPVVSDYLARFPRDAETIQAIFSECGTIAVRERAPEERSRQPAESNGGADRSATSPGDQTLKPGTECGNYTILRLIGQGGMGAVYQAEHRRMRRKVAIKIIAPAALRYPESLQRFHREVQAMARLEHPNIVTAHDADQVGDMHFLVMQYVDGNDLSTIVKLHGPLTVDMAVRCLVQTARGLEYAHREGLVHRDIKPSNLVVAKNGLVKILDMGLARLEDALTSDGAGTPGLTESGNIMGTIDFMAPEQALDAKAADRRADIYSLGCTLHYLLTAHRLYAGDTVMKRIMAHRFEPVPSLRVARPDVPEWLDAIFQKMIAKQVADRYQSMTEVLTALAPYVASGLSNPETDVSMPGRGSLPDDPAPLRPAAALLVKVPGVESSPLDVAMNQTASSTGFDTLCQAIAAERQVPAAKAPGAPSTSVFRKEIAATARKSMRSRPSTTKQLLLIGGSILGLLAILAGIVVKLKTKDGTLVVEINEPDAEVQVLDDAGKVEITRKGKKGQITISVVPGKHQLKVQKDGFAVFAEKFEIESEGMKPITAKLEPLANESTVAGKGWQEWPADAPRPAIAPFDAVQAKKHQQEWAAYLKLPVERTNSIGMKLVLIPPGEFTIGTTQQEAEEFAAQGPQEIYWTLAWLSSAPVHSVRLTKPFYMGVHEVTQEEYEKVSGSNPSHFSSTGAGKDKVAGEDTKRYPVEQVSFIDAVEFCQKLNSLEMRQEAFSRTDNVITLLPGDGYRLPTEAEWIWACRGNTKTPWVQESDILELSKVAWHSEDRTHPVGKLKINPFGLYDVYGNVWEWCLDGFDQQAYARRGAGTTADPLDPVDIGGGRVAKGGHWQSGALACRAALRCMTPADRSFPFSGFRVVMAVNVSRPAR